MHHEFIRQNVYYTRFLEKMEVPLEQRRESFKKYFGDSHLCISNREEATSYLQKVLSNIQTDMVSTINTGNTKRIIIELLKIQDKCFNHYYSEKSDRQRFIQYKVDSSNLQYTYEINRNIAQDMLYGINI